jgi:thiol-disulfide isomerase/thioredoxin
MKKLILICLLGYLGLSISTLTAQVADSPGADFLHRSTLHVSFGLGDTHRGEETRSDTFHSGFSLVDDSTFQEQEGASSSAHSDTLTIGDHIPADIEFTSVLKLAGNSINLDQLKGKYKVLHFWATSCSASIKSLLETDRLQKDFEGQIDFVPITFEPQEKVKQTLDQFGILEKTDLPIVTSDARLQRLIPHLTIPHFVILDPEGEIIAITGKEDLTTEKLQQLLDTGKPSFRLKSDATMSLRPDEFLIPGNEKIPEKNIRYLSALTGYIPEVKSSLIQKFDFGSYFRIVNMSLFKHYQFAYSGHDIVDYFGVNRIVLEGFEEDEITSSKTGLDYREWKMEGGHVYSYELILPPGIEPFEYMRQELKKFFPHIEAEVQMRKRTVYALVCQEGKCLPKSHTNERSYQIKPYGVKMTNYPLQGLVYHLNSFFLQLSPYPLINLTGIDYPIDLRFEAQLASIESLRGEFQSLGLDLIKKEMEIPVLVLRKLDGNKSIQP